MTAILTHHDARNVQWKSGFRRQNPGIIFGMHRRPIQRPSLPLQKVGQDGPLRRDRAFIGDFKGIAVNQIPTIGNDPRAPQQSPPNYKVSSKPRRRSCVR